LDLDRAASVGLYHAGVPPGDGPVLPETLVRVPGSRLAHPRLEEGPWREQGQEAKT